VDGIAVLNIEGLREGLMRGDVVDDGAMLGLRVAGADDGSMLGLRVAGADDGAMLGLVVVGADDGAMLGLRVAVGTDDVSMLGQKEGMEEGYLVGMIDL